MSKIGYNNNESNKLKEVRTQSSKKDEKHFPNTKAKPKQEEFCDMIKSVYPKAKEHRILKKHQLIDKDKFGDFDYQINCPNLQRQLKQIYETRRSLPDNFEEFLDIFIEVYGSQETKSGTVAISENNNQSSEEDPIKHAQAIKSQHDAIPSSQSNKKYERSDMLFGALWTWVEKNGFVAIVQKLQLEKDVLAKQEELKEQERKLTNLQKQNDDYKATLEGCNEELKNTKIKYEQLLNDRAEENQHELVKQLIAREEIKHTASDLQKENDNLRKTIKEQEKKLYCMQLELERQVTDCEKKIADNEKQMGDYKKKIEEELERKIEDANIQAKEEVLYYTVSELNVIGFPVPDSCRVLVNKQKEEFEQDGQYWKQLMSFDLNSVSPPPKQEVIEEEKQLKIKPIEKEILKKINFLLTKRETDKTFINQIKLNTEENKNISTKINQDLKSIAEEIQKLKNEPNKKEQDESATEDDDDYKRNKVVPTQKSGRSLERTPSIGFTYSVDNMHNSEDQMKNSPKKVVNEQLSTAETKVSEILGVNKDEERKDEEKSKHLKYITKPFANETQLFL